MTKQTCTFVSARRFTQMRDVACMNYDESRPELRNQKSKQKMKQLSYNPLLF